MFGMSKDGAPADRRRGSAGLRPAIEGLEQRLLLYSTLGGQWSYGSRITYSFAPDGTNVGGIPSAMAQAMASRGITESQWKTELRRAAAVWQSAANINLSEVPDSGAAFGLPGNQQNDPRFGDIRIAATPDLPSVLGYAFPPPPINGGTRAGDVVLNSSSTWNVGANFDLQTVAIHEIGHALGLDHSGYSDSVVYDYYNGVKQYLSTDDIAGIRALYGVRQQDWVDQYWNNKDPWNAVNISGLIDGNRKATLPNLDITSNQDEDWYYIQAPSNTSGEMIVTMQSKDLSSLSPRFQVYNTSLQLVGWTVSQNPGTVYGSTISVRFTGVPAGTGVYIKAMGWNGQSSGVNGIGAYAFQVDFSGGPVPTAIVSPPNTTVLEQPDQWGGSFNQVIDVNGAGDRTWYSLDAPSPGGIHLASRFDTHRAAWEDTPISPPSRNTVTFTTPGWPGRGPFVVMPRFFVQAVDAAIATADPDGELPGASSKRSRRAEEVLAGLFAE